MRLIAEKKQAIIRETFLSPTEVEKKDIKGTDLLSLLLRANMASDLPEKARMSDKDIVSQVPTFLIAGVCPPSVVHCSPLADDRFTYSTKVSGC